MNYRLLLCSLLLSCLVGCEQAQQTIPTFKVTQRPFILNVPATGELEAAKAEVISAPSQRSMTIAWLEQEYSNVKKGQLIAKFDGEKLSLDMRKEMLAMMLLEQDIALKQSSLTQDELDVAKDKQLVVKEFAFADEFAIDDVRLYSRMEIIEKMQNKDYLGAKDNYLNWKKESVVDQNSSAIDVLSIRKQGSEAKYDQLQNALSTLEVYAPYDGLLVYQSNWRGEKPTVGETVFPGMTIAKLPDLSQMQVKAYVLDKEAIGLAKGQPATIRLDAFPEQEFSGTLSEVSGFSRTISRANPTKYFEVTIALDDRANKLFTPGRKLSAQITVHNGTPKLLVPTQSIHNEDGLNYVFKQHGTTFVKQAVSIGAKNLYFVEITDGLVEGDYVALSLKELL